MKLLLTSQGLTNKTISEALFKLAGKRANELNAAFVPTAATFMDDDKNWLVNQLNDVKKSKISHDSILWILQLSRKKNGYQGLKMQISSFLAAGIHFI